MRHKITSLANYLGLLLLLPSAMVLLGGCTSGSQQPPLLIGHVVPFQGPEGNVDDSSVRGVGVAVAAVNSDEEQKIGRPIVVLHAGAKPTRKSFEAQAVRLVRINQVAGLLGGWTAEQVGGLQQGMMPVVSPSGLREQEQEAAVFLTGLPPAQKGKALAQVAVSHRFGLASPVAMVELAAALGGFPANLTLAGVKGIAAKEEAPPHLVVLVDQRRKEFAAVGDAFVKELTMAGKLPRPPVWRYTTDTEFDDQLRHLEDENPDVMFLAGTADAVRTFRTRVKNKKLPLFFAGPPGSWEMLLLGKSTNHDIWTATAWLPEIDTKQNKKFIEQYKKAHGEMPDVHAALAYDNARALFAALKQCDDYFTPEEIEKKLSELTDFPSLTGKTGFSPDRILRRPVFVIALRDGEAKLVERVEAAKDNRNVKEKE